MDPPRIPQTERGPRRGRRNPRYNHGGSGRNYSDQSEQQPRQTKPRDDHPFAWQKEVPPKREETKQPQVKETRPVQEPRPPRTRARPYDADVPLKPAKYTKVSEITPESTGINVKCVVLEQPRLVKDQRTVTGVVIKNWLVKVGDDSGAIEFLLDNPTIGDSLQANTHMTLRNVFVDMADHKFMQLQSNGWSKLDVETQPHSFTAQGVPNMSEVEYEIEG
mmetsp:Transcript_5381/g.9902  ORF Transcript_5381/g.9902 Transcript_5381/m.9902 type:complete len:220 (+) Transcript_5381:655-1314(+)